MCSPMQSYVHRSLPEAIVQYATTNSLKPKPRHANWLLHQRPCRPRFRECSRKSYPILFAGPRTGCSERKTGRGALVLRSLCDTSFATRELDVTPTKTDRTELGTVHVQRLPARRFSFSGRQTPSLSTDLVAARASGIHSPPDPFAGLSFARRTDRFDIDSPYLLGPAIPYPRSTQAGCCESRGCSRGVASTL